MIVERHTLSIGAFVDNIGDRSLAGGRWYTDKALIPSLLAVPVYVVSHLNDRIRGVRLEYADESDR